MFDVGQTAEDFLRELQDRLFKQADSIEGVLYPLYDTLPERQQILAMGPLDHALEMRRAANALEDTIRHLLAPEIPCEDVARG